jgi:RNA polymerase sigma-70 factor (ECF subfamily)
MAGDRSRPLSMDGTSTIRNEAQMIEAILAGDTQLYHELIRPYERAVYLMALSYVKSETEAEDIAQEAFIKAYRSLATFRAEAKFSTWLISITLNEARGRLRRKANLREEPLEELTDDDQPISPALLRDWREIPSEALERMEVRALLRRAVEALPAIYREVFVLRDVEELNVNETAATLKISVASVKVRLHRARIMLQKQLAPVLKAAAPERKRRWFR